MSHAHVLDLDLGLDLVHACTNRSWLAAHRRLDFCCMRMHARLMHDLLHLHGTDWRCLGGFRQFRGSYSRFSSSTTILGPLDPYTVGKLSPTAFHRAKIPKTEK
jgi:hypothetical protein